MSEPAPLPLSVAIACRDNEKTIGRTLDSVRGLAAEIVAADSGSRDGTLRLLREAGATIIRTRWLGYVRTKQLAVDHCTQPWVLLLDSDESLEPKLAASLRDTLAEPDHGMIAARVNRRVWYRGKPLRHAFQPEWRVRLARRDRMTIAGYDPHDRVDVDLRAGEEIFSLAGDLRHDSFASFAEHFARQARHARDAAASLHAAGKRGNVARVLTAGPVELFKQAILKSAWRDGPAGWLAATSMAVYATMKHACLLENAAYPLAQSDAAAGGTKTGAAASFIPSSPPRDTAVIDSPMDPAPGADPAGPTDQPASPHADSPHASPSGGDSEGPRRRKRRRRRGRRKEGGDDTTSAVTSDIADDSDDDAAPEDEPRRKRGLSPVKPISDEAREQVFDTAQGFKDLGLKPELLSTLAAAGWEYPTKIQAALIPLALTRKDILGQAKTGSGKTAAFGLPLLNMVEKGRAFQALILAPTRELALQIRDDLEGLGARTGLQVCPVYGGQKIFTQAKRLERGPEIIVGTPGRVMDMQARGLLRLDDVRFAVLDEVDRMFDIGFREDIRRILSMCPKERQTIFVSATISDEIERLARKHMQDPERLIVSSGSLTVEMVKQFHIPVQGWDKRRMLTHVLTHEEPDLTIVFCRMKRTVDDVVRYLGEKGIEAHALHGDMSQGARNRTMKEFRHGELNVLVASDLAARGLDVEGITHVVNYDLPDDPDLYVHRIGRTARAGRDGVAWSLVTPEQGSLLTQIENLINAEIPKLEYPDFDARKDPPAGYRPEAKPGQYTVVGVPDKVSRNRLDANPVAPAEKKLSDEQLAAKFPGGLVPKKPPKKVMRGKVRTPRGNAAE